jgi:hypothetical protein
MTSTLVERVRQSPPTERGKSSLDGPGRLTRAGSRQACRARNSARAQRSAGAPWNVGWCGRQDDRPQLMRRSLGTLAL